MIFFNIFFCRKCIFFSFYRFLLTHSKPVFCFYAHCASKSAEDFCRRFQKISVNFGTTKLDTGLKWAQKHLHNLFSLCFIIVIAIIVIYLCIHSKCNPWNYVTMTRNVRPFKLRKACSATAKIEKLWLSGNSKIQFQDKYRQLLPSTNSKHSTIIRWRATWTNLSL